MNGDDSWFLAGRLFERGAMCLRGVWPKWDRSVLRSTGPLLNPADKAMGAFEIKPGELRFDGLSRSMAAVGFGQKWCFLRNSYAIT